LVIISVALRLLGIGVRAAMPWASVLFYPAFAAFLPIALLGGWLAVVTHDWNLDEKPRCDARWRQW